MSKLFLILVVLALIIAPLSAQDKPAPKEEKKPEQVKKEEPKPEFPPMETFIKDLEKIEGFYTLFHKQEQLFALIKKSQLNQPFLMAFSISGGPELTGWQWDDMVVKWEIVDKTLLLIKPNLKHRVDKPTTVSETVTKTYTDSVVHAVPILSMDGGSVLVDCNAIFKRDIAEISTVVSWLLGAGGFNPQLSSWSKIKVFPNNVELEVKATFTGGSSYTRHSSDWNPWSRGLVADGRGIRMNIHYSLSSLPQTGYTPRIADDRVGYFLTVYKDYAKPYNTKSQFVRFVNRWQVEKADPDLEVSPPKKPIIFYIEKTVPVRFRHYIKEGILEWNKAFEKIGIVDAIIVRQQTDKEFADIDPEDVNYNFFRWITTGIPYAMGPSRVNPMTGQILDADIVFDDSFTRYLNEEYRFWGPESLATIMDKKSYDKIKKLPMWQHIFERKTGETPEPFTEMMEKAFSHPAWENRLGGLKSHHCECGLGMAYQLALASMVFEAKEQIDTKIPEKYVGLVVKELTTHEVGHTLGLRHNFKGSSWLKLSQINTKENPPEITSGSIMDYNPINFAPQGSQGNYQTAGLGPYDYWAIEYGYAMPPKGESEEKLLEKIAQKVATPGLAYGTDEEASLYDPDPLIVRWDLGDDPIEFAKSKFAVALEIKKNVMEKIVKKGESYSNARRAMDIILWQYTSSALKAGHYIGGEYFHRDHKGDPNARPPFVIVPVQKQREALQFLAQEVFSSKNFQFSPEFLNYLAPGRWLHWGSDNFDFDLPYPIHDEILWAQVIPLVVLYSPWTIGRVHDMELQVPADQEAVTVPEVMDSITNAIFSELDDKEMDKKQFSPRKPLIESTRRGLQLECLRFLFFIGTTQWGSMFYHPDVCAVANMQLQNLLKKTDAILQNTNIKLDTYTQAHLIEIKRQIENELYDKKKK